MSNLSIYIHYPFCLSKCPYCDFNSYMVDNGIDEQLLINCYKKEIEYYYKLLKDRKIKTIFFGGGTPSLMSINLVESILNCISKFWDLDKNVEISLEANPNSIKDNKFKQYRQLGINRLSIGVQSLNDQQLKFLGRIHTVNEVISSIELAQKYFDKRYSIDLIYARPQQKLKAWIQELNEAVKLSPYHISLYQLTIVEGTIFFKSGIKPLNNYRASIMYNRTNEILEQNNIFRYEVSNYSQKGYECQHNLNYWNSGEWMGIGAGASGRLCLNQWDSKKQYLIRTAIDNFKNVNDWIKSVLKNGSGAEKTSVLTKQEFIEEVLLMGLRTTTGIELNNVSKYLKIDSIVDLITNQQNLKFLQDNNFINYNSKNIKVVEDKFNVLDSIIERLIY